MNNEQTIYFRTILLDRKVSASNYTKDMKKGEEPGTKPERLGPQYNGTEAFRGLEMLRWPDLDQ